MATAPHAGSVRSALEPLLGRDRCVALQAVLISRVVAWAAETAPGAIHVAYEPADAGADLRALLGSEPMLFPQNGAGPSGRLANASARAFASGHGPVLIVWPELPRWRPEHAAGALADLVAGCDVSLGPVFDGGFYLIALSRPLALFALPTPAWRTPDAIGAAFLAAQESGLELGLLRAERGLRSPEDVRAAVADPLLDPELRGLLESARPAPRPGYPSRLGGEDLNPDSRDQNPVSWPVGRPPKALASPAARIYQRPPRANGPR